MPAPMRFLIGSPAGALPESVFLHVFDDGVEASEAEWLPERFGALQFGAFDAADRFAREHRLGAVEISEHPATDLVRPALHAFDRAAAVA